jgi:hypothetical protein
MTHFETLLQNDKQDQVHYQVYNRVWRLVRDQVRVQAFDQVREELNDTL